MPELPEVEHFRSLLIPFVASKFPLQIELLLEAYDDDDDKHSKKKTPPRKFLSVDDIHLINQSSCHVSDVTRKGKLICMTLEPTKSTNIVTAGVKAARRKKDATSPHHANKFYIFLHMGMTGRISTPNYIPRLESLAKNKEERGDISKHNNYRIGGGVDSDKQSPLMPPPHAFLKIMAGNDHVIFFSDPRKFGSVILYTTINNLMEESEFSSLAPDALELMMSYFPSTTKPTTSSSSLVMTQQPQQQLLWIQGLIGQSTGIKTILLDQKRVMSGVGNWIADEVLYQCRIHPNQTHLTEDQVLQLGQTLKSILTTAIDCLQQQKEFPDTWLFHHRWDKRKSNSSRHVVKDPQGRNVSFIKSGGRTSAIVASIQKVKKRQMKIISTNNNKRQRKRLVEEDER